MRTLLLAALLLAAPTAQAAKPPPGAALLDDAATFRATLPSVAANLMLDRAGHSSSARLVADATGLTLTDAVGAPFDVGPTAPDLPLRLLAAALDHKRAEASFTQLGCRLTPTAQGLFLFAHPAESLVVARVGDPKRCWLGLEPELGRPREWAIQLDGQLWMARIAAYSDASNGWFPQRIDIVRNGEVLLAATVTSVAPTPADLPPLAAPAPNPIALPAPTVPTEKASKSSPLRLPL